MASLLSTIPFRWFKDDGTPAEGYTAKFYDAGTADPKTIYQDEGGTPYPSPSNEAVLNAEGYAVIYLGVGQYKMVITDELDAFVFEVDNIAGGGGGGGGSLGTAFIDMVIDRDDTGAGIKDVDPVANHFVWCAGYYAPGDGGHGFFWNETSAQSPDGGYIIASDIVPTVRWFRVPDESSDIRSESFGYIGTLAEDLSDQLLAAAGHASGYGHRLVIGPGTSAIISTPDDSDFFLYTIYGVHFAAGSMLTGDGGFTILKLFGPVTGTPEKHFTGFQAKFETTQENAHPEWFGALPFLSEDNTANFALWFNSGAKAFTLPPGVWGYDDTTTFPYPTVPLTLLGSINSISTGSDIPTGVYFPDDSIFKIGTLQSGIVKASNKLQFQAGLSTVYIRSGGQLRNIIGSASTVGTAETDLLNFSLGANTLINVGDRIHVTAAGNYTGVSGDKIPRCRIGGISIGGGSQVTTDLGRWRFEIDLYYTGVGASFSEWVNFEFAFTPLLFSTNFNTLTVPTIDFTIANVLAITGQCTAGAMNNTVLSVDFFPAP